MPDTNPNQHPLNEGCFFCATDTEIVRSVRLSDEGKPWDSCTLQIQAPENFCPHVTVVDTANSTEETHNA